MVAEHEKAIAEFKEADDEFQTIRSFIESGEFLREVFDRSQGNFNTASQIWEQIWKKLAELNEDRNSKLKTVKDTMRRVVQLAAQQRRGPEGSATVVKSEMFTVSSVTHRNLKAEVVMDMCRAAGLQDELATLTYTDKMGAQKPALMVEYELNYERAISWLKSKNMLAIIEAAYEEVEKTPAVKGPKETAFLGEKKTE